MSSCIHRLFRHIAALKRSFRGGVSILLTPAHETQPRQNPVLLVSSRAGKGSQSFSSHLGRYNHLGTILPRTNAETATYRDMSRRQARQIGDHGKRGMPRSNIRWPTGHSKGAATGGAHGRRWERNPPRQLIGEPLTESHTRQMNNGARQNCRARASATC